MALVELGLIFVGLALLHRTAYHLGFSPIPFILLAGLAFGEGGIAPLRFSESFVQITAEIGSLLLLFMLGLEYSGQELREALETHLPDSLVDLLLNFLPGFLLALGLGWSLPLALLMGGATLITSSGILAHLIAELKWEERPEARIAISLSILEDMLVALLLPPAALLLFRVESPSVGPMLLTALLSVGALWVAIRFGQALSHAVDHESDGVLLLSLFGLTLLAGGLATLLQIPAAISGFLLGIAVSDPVKERARRLIGPVRDLSATVFFLTLGLRLDPGLLPPVLPLAVGLTLITGFTKGLTGWWAARRQGLDRWARWRTGALMIARGEFSGVIAGLVLQAMPSAPFVPLTAAYVLLSAIVGPLLVHRLPGAKP
ncbi:cation:proton antiporter [Thermoflexus sp.]|uniref:cation:proton antiporter n=1 Tax=Thermoflexus sp. TaxID=1969742 RepID=UPI0025D180A1|nr:cation:proton antiporter [Thermoflexus sp.]MDW8179478.1 cation:proton antiporter [Anaerolineae bacterium]MCS6964917.1 cation:proton antiporter [Thermoflexus sp.]MCS7350030.1 cation:proton antiporter [Thermoflexus sp.]MCX7690998.1 cation:proton antiporter [Thermoflexus sp.]MDW8185416.1 cation:proton antiporter [Anaerolineae bacterium]